MAIGRADSGDHSVVVVLRPLTTDVVQNQAPSRCGGAFFVWFEPLEAALFR